MSVPPKWQWFADARFGMFLHWGAYARYGRGEQVLFREHLDQQEYAAAARAWNPTHFDADRWAATAVRMGMKYGVLTTRHHDGFCLWDTATTDYSTAAQAAGRDFVKAYVEAFRAAGLKVGLYYSLADWRIPAYWDGPDHDPDGWARFRDYVHAQVTELLSNYGEIDIIWFDGAWPHTANRWGAFELIETMRRLQPNLLINNRLGPVEDDSGDGSEESVGKSTQLGDFGTPEHHITAETGRMWESCQVSTWRLWGYTIGERWRPADLLLDMLIEAVQKGGNLLLNVGPTPEGFLPPQFETQADAIGRWVAQHAEVLERAEPGEVCEFITYGKQLRAGHDLYLVIRFWDRRGEVHVGGLATKVRRAVLVTTGQEVPFEQRGDDVWVRGLPAESPSELFPVLKLEFDQRPEAAEWAKARLWGGDPRRMREWAAARGTSVWADGRER